MRGITGENAHMLSERLKSLGIALPALAGPFGAYVPARRAGDLVYVSGQLPVKDGRLIAAGPVPSQCALEQAQLAARQCAINALAAAASVEGGVDRITGVLRVGVFVCCDPGFAEQPKVANGASELFLEIFGDPGRHVRAAVGVAALPLGATVELEAVFTCRS